MEIDKFDLLEKKISEMLGRYARLKEEKNQLLKDLQQKDHEIQDLKAIAENQNEEKELVRTKLDKLIDNLENI